MNGEGCWSTVVCRPTERAALGLTGESPWLLQCRLAIGHRGNHATDASVHPRHDRRLWLEWNDFDDRAQSLIERNPCPVPSPEGVGCVFFAGHGGPHFYARSNGHAPSVMTGVGGVQYARPTGEPGAVPAPRPGGPQTGPIPTGPTPPGPTPPGPTPPGPTPPGPTPPGPGPAVPPQRAVQPHQPPLRMGSHRLPDSHVAAPGEADHAAGGRGGADAEPPSPEDYQGRRRRPEPPVEPEVPVEARPSGTTTFDTPVAVTAPTVTPDPAPSVPADPQESASISDAARRAAISAALDELSIALAHLAAALRS